MARNRGKGIDWMGLPMIAVVARLLCRELTLENEYLRLERQKWDYGARRTQPGRPRRPDEIEALVCRLARENVWGYQWIRREVLKVGIQRSKGCIADILRRNGLPPIAAETRTDLAAASCSPCAGAALRRSLHQGSMDLHGSEDGVCPLRPAPAHPPRHPGGSPTFSPYGAWMRQMGRNLLMTCEDLGVAPQVVVHDRDGLLVHDLDVTLHAAGVEVVKTPFRAPDANAHAERWVRSVTGECLDHLILIGLGRLRRSFACYATSPTGIGRIRELATRYRVAWRREAPPCFPLR